MGKSIKMTITHPMTLPKTHLESLSNGKLQEFGKSRETHKNSLPQVPESAFSHKSHVPSKMSPIYPYSLQPYATKYQALAGIAITT